MGYLSNNQFRWEKYHIDCEHPDFAVANWDFWEDDITKPKVNNRWCARCCTRWFRDKVYNPDEWDVYINEEETN